MISTLRNLCCVLLMFATIANVGCSNSEPYVACSLNLSSRAAVFDASGGTSTITVSPFPDTETWEVVCEATEEWFSYTIDGSNLIVTATPNPTTDTRSGSLSITSVNNKFATQAIEIRQEASIAVDINTSAPESYTFDSEGGSYTFTIASNYAWDASLECPWATLSRSDAGNITVTAEPNTTTTVREATLTITAGNDYNTLTKSVAISQTTRADNPYFKLVGKWQITASNWFYTNNGSLNSLDGSPSSSLYYLIFDIEEGTYGESLYMRDFLYPGTSLEVRYDPTTEGFIIPFGWSVYKYEVFLYITLVSNKSFSYAAMEVPVVPSAEHTILTPEMPIVSGYNNVGFGLWSYSDNGDKEAFGSKMHPTMYPMGNIRFIKSQN